MRLNTRVSKLLAGALAVAAIAGVGYAIYHHHAETVQQAGPTRYEAAVKANTRPMTRAERCAITVPDTLAQAPDALRLRVTPAIQWSSPWATHTLNGPRTSAAS